MLVLLLFGGLLLVIRIPSVQTKAVQKAALYVSETIDHEVTIESVDIKFFSRVVLNKVKVLDYKRQEMFSIGQVDADISAFSIFHPDRLTIDNLKLTQPRVHLIQYAGTDSLNLSTFIHSLSRLIKQDTTKQATFDFKIKGIELQNGFFVYDDQNEPYTEFGMDYQHLVIDSIYGKLSDIRLNGDTIGADIRGLRATEKRSKAYLKHLDVKMTFAPTFWEYADLNLRFNESNLRNYVRFDYHRFSNFTDFNDSVTLTTRLDSSYVTAENVAIFAPQLREYKEKILIWAEAKGKVSDFDARNVDLRFGDKSRIVGNVSADGLPNVKETFMELKLKPSILDARDLRTYIPKEAMAYAERLGTVRLEGKFMGFYNDFVADGSFSTAIGSLVSDINLKFDENRKNSSYRGYLRTDNFNVGKLIGQTDVIKTISMNGRVEGRGFTLADARMKLDATIHALNIFDYNYRNITTNASLTRQTFTGDLRINDPNLALNLTGEVDLSQVQEVFNVELQLERANLLPLNLSSKNITVQTQASLHFTGNQLDEADGSARFYKTLISYEDLRIPVDSIRITADRQGQDRVLTITSDLLALKASGNFSYSRLVEDVKTLFKEYRLNFESDDAATAAYYRTKPKTVLPDYEIDYNLTLRHINPLLHIFVPELTVSDYARMEGSFRSGNTTIFSLAGTIDTLIYNKNYLYRNNFEVNTSKLPQSTEVLASAIFTSQKQHIPSAGDLENFFVEAVWNERTIGFSTNVRQTGTDNRATISGNLNFLDDALQIVFNRSNINLLGKVWNISQDNTILINDRELDFQNFSLSHNEQVISIAGAVSENPARNLLVNIANFEVQNLNPLLPVKMYGMLNAELNMSNVYKQLILSSQLRIDSFKLDEVLIGDVSGRSSWDNRLQKLEVNLGILRNGAQVLYVAGHYNPYSQDQQLNLLASMEKAPFKLVEPFLNVVMHDLSGTLEGQVRVLGKLSEPVLKGNVLVNDGRFTLTYLNTVYAFTDRVNFSEEGINFRRIRLQDIYGNTAYLNGNVFHKGFQDFRLGLDLSYTRFMVLNTTRDLNEMYFGQAFATGTATITGPAENLTINVDASSDKGTRIYIPFDTRSSLERQSYINFVNRNVTDTLGVRVAVQEQRVDLSGIRLNFNLDITEDAYAEIILNEATGDIIRGNGKGRIRMNIDTRGEFNMYGQFEIVKGRYNFTFAEGVVGREFIIRPGGTITFNGDPLNANLNVTASYTQRTVVPGTLLGLPASAHTVRLPVSVLMNLTGNIMTPDIRLALEFREVPSDLDEFISSYQNKLRTDEQELNRQVFSILVFKRMAEEGAALGAGGGGLGDAALANTAGEIFSSMFSNWINQIDTNLEIDVGVGGQSQELLQDVQLRVSYRLLKGRMRITREGGIANSNNLNQSNRTTQTSVAGDWTVEYYLRPDGKLRMRLEYQTTPSTFDPVNLTSTSLSLQHNERFDTFKELAESFTSLFKGRKARERERLEEEQLRPRYDIDNDEPTPML